MRPRAAVATLAVLALLLPLLAPPAAAQENGTLPIPEAPPEAPEPVANLIVKALSLGRYILIGLGVLGVIAGVAKFAIGAPGAGSLIVKGFLALAFGLGLWAILRWVFG